jgi:hypothetical protein
MALINGFTWLVFEMRCVKSILEKCALRVTLWTIWLVQEPEDPRSRRRARAVGAPQASGLLMAHTLHGIQTSSKRSRSGSEKDAY